MNLMKAGLALQGASMDQADNDQNEWDRREQAAEQRDMAIEGRVNALGENKADIYRILSENIEDLYRVSLEAYDTEKAITEAMDSYLRNEAIESLNLGT